MADRTKITLNGITVVGETQGDVLTVNAAGEVVASGVSVGGGGVDTTAIHKATAAELSAMTAKATPVDADILVIEDSAASWAKKKVTLANVVALASGSGGSATPDYTYWSPDAPPASPDTDNDEFDGSAGSGTPSGFTEFDPDSTIDWKQERENGFEFSTGAAVNVCGYYKACGSFSTFQSQEIYTKVSLRGVWDNSSTNRIEGGVAYWEDASGTIDEIVTAGFSLKEDTGIGLNLKSWTDYNSIGTTDLSIESDPPMFTTCYIKLKCTEVFGSYGYEMSYSTGGGWVKIGTATATFAPTHYGIYITGATNYAFFSFFRVRGPALADEYAIYGDRVNGYTAT